MDDKPIYLECYIRQCSDIGVSVFSGFFAVIITSPLTIASFKVYRKLSDVVFISFTLAARVRRNTTYRVCVEENHWKNPSDLQRVGDGKQISEDNGTGESDEETN